VIHPKTALGNARWWGLLAYVFYLAHAGYFLSVGREENLVWGCHMAALGVGTGLLFRVPLFNGMAVLSFMWGVPLWLIGVATGDEFLPTSMGTHIGGAILGVVGLYRLGYWPKTWIVLWFTTIGLVGVSSLISSEAENVNLSLGPPREGLPTGAGWYAMLFTGAAITFFTCEQALRWWLRRVSADGATELSPEGPAA
jgi:hypothetical protein